MPSSDLATEDRDLASRCDQDLMLRPSGRGERAIWLIIGGSLAGLLFACHLLNFRIALGSGLLTVAANVILLVGGVVIEKHGWPRLSAWLRATALMTFVTILLTALSYVLASTNLPLRDTALISLDQAIGIDWRSFVNFMMKQQVLMIVLNAAYVSLHAQYPLLLPLLFLLGQHDEGMQFALVWTIRLAATVLIFPLAPALGGYLHYQLDPKDVPEVRVFGAWLFAPPFQAVRDGSLNVLDLSKLDGIITFPSFHAAAAVLMGWRWFAVPLLRWPMLLLNILMLVSAVPVGGHYIVDVIAGSLLAILAIIATSRLHPVSEGKS
ncbi:phosphatase PAP2 family protein [Bradyrhizobium rifense]|uniref:Phosphatase PAP2 family protein n=1 Tax=Bradyrhizobium rifense TaxID=515499 RepID=A0A5D3KCV1_9BRAD|nr:phosphatase PAP2 family protein [Bradyrhizobium rifense]TYL92944.1 phosphatase PAP2 family protein [Bradyrhizobium rifense]